MHSCGTIWLYIPLLILGACAIRICVLVSGTHAGNIIYFMCLMVARCELSVPGRCTLELLHHNPPGSWHHFDMPQDLLWLLFFCLFAGNEITCGPFTQYFAWLRRVIFVTTVSAVPEDSPRMLLIIAVALQLPNTMPRTCMILFFHRNTFPIREIKMAHFFMTITGPSYDMLSICNIGFQSLN